MKRKFSSAFFTVALISIFFASCKKDIKNYGEAAIIFDQTNPVIIEDGKFTVSGKVQSDNGTVIDRIDVFCLHINGDRQITTGVATIDSLTMEFFNHYEFYFTEENTIIGNYLDSLIGIMINANVTNGMPSTNTIKIINEFELEPEPDTDDGEENNNNDESEDKETD